MRSHESKEAGQLPLKELEELRREAEAIGTIARHDLRNPLNTILINVDLLREVTASGDVEDSLDLIEQSTRELARAIDALGDYMRLRSVPLHIENLDVSQVVRDVMKRIAPKLPPDAEIRVDGELGHVRGDAELLGIAFEHLLRNAVTFTSDGQAPRVKIHTEADEEGCWYLITDNGPGFPDGDGAKLFRLFGRLRHRPEREGFGLGLATVARIAERHGGGVAAVNGPDGGATFRFCLGEAP